MQSFHISYGAIQRSTSTLEEARAIARELSAQMRYDIHIISRGDIVETWQTRVSESGKLTTSKAVHVATVLP